jgi:hypothetical protein
MEVSNELEEKIFANLESIRKSASNKVEPSSSNVTQTNENDVDDPDLLLQKLPKLENRGSWFDFESKRAYFDDVYFTKSRFFPKNSKENQDFWTFLRKYQALMKRKASETRPTGQNKCKIEFSEKLKMPLSYDKRWRLNFVYNSNKSNANASYDSFGNTVKQAVTEEQHQEFEFIIHLYLDFLQKEKFKKLKQLRLNQSNLPIFKYKEAILNTIKENQVTIIAGDTGCGKSTQIPRYLLEANYERIACTQVIKIVKKRSKGT